MDDEEFLLQVLANIEEAEVLTIFFPLLRQALVVDARHSPEVGPLLAVAPQVASMPDRVAWVVARRPQFGRPEYIMAVPWLKSIRSLAEHGVLARIQSQLIRRGVPTETAELLTGRVYAELVQMEHGALVAVIRGDGFQTLWQARD